MSRLYRYARYFSTRIQHDIDASSLLVSKGSRRPVPPPEKLVFGHTFTDHMLMIPWTQADGWAPPAIVPYGPLSLDPSSTVLHYAPTLFEGMKAYKGEDGEIRLFRPDMNMERMNKSASRLAFPTFTGDNLVSLIKSLVALDHKWIPSLPGYSLYIRPTMIGTQAVLGVAPSNSVLLFVICSPVGPYYSTGFKPVRLLASTKYCRAFHGGTGGYKLGANYAGGVIPALEAAKEGYQQILWLQDGNYLSEAGTMNIFAVFKKSDGRRELVTPPLGDTILPGVTRDSVLALARGEEGPGLDDDLDVSERDVSMDEVETRAKAGELLEMFGTGTAAVVSPIKDIGYEGRSIPVPTDPDGLGRVSRAVLAAITARQTGRVPSSWAVRIDPPNLP